MAELDISGIPKLDIEDSLANSIKDDFFSLRLDLGEDTGWQEEEEEFIASFQEEMAYYTQVTPFSPSSIKKGGKWTYVLPK